MIFQGSIPTGHQSPDWGSTLCTTEHSEERKILFISDAAHTPGSLADRYPFPMERVKDTGHIPVLGEKLCLLADDQIELIQKKRISADKVSDLVDKHITDTLRSNSLRDEVFPVQSDNASSLNINIACTSNPEPKATILLVSINPK